MLIYMLYILTFFLIFSSMKLSIILIILVVTAVLLGSLLYLHHQKREVYRSGLARQATDAMCNASERFRELLDAEGIDSPASQDALRELIRTQWSMRDTHPNIDCETPIAALIKLVKK